MPNDDRTRPLPRLLIALVRPRRSADAPAFELLADALAHELPVSALPLALLRLRRHLRGDGRARRCSVRRLQLLGGTAPLRADREEPGIDVQQDADGAHPDQGGAE